MVAMPRRASFAADFGPTPFSRRTDSGDRRVATSCSVTTVRPSGLSSSEAIFATSLLGARPTEQRSPVASSTACFSSRPTSRAHHHASAFASTGSTSGPSRAAITSVRSMKISSMPRSSTCGASARTAALKSREYLRYSSKSTGSRTASGAFAAAFIIPMAELTPNARAS